MLRSSSARVVAHDRVESRGASPKASARIGAEIIDRFPGGFCTVCSTVKTRNNHRGLANGMLLTAERTDLTPHAFVTEHADVFATFDASTQDSGDVRDGASLGV